MHGMEVRMRSALVLLVLTGLASPVYGQVAGGQFFYGRLGYGAVATDNTRPSTAIGFGFRGELDTVAVDFSFANLILPSGHGEGGVTFGGSMFRLQILRFFAPQADRSFYIGGGMSYAGVTAGDAHRSDTIYTTGWGGTGMQGDLAVGYELARSSPIRFFIQTDVGLPLFKARQHQYPVTNRVVDYNSPSIEKRYMPSAAVTFGIGWQHRRP